MGLEQSLGGREELVQKKRGKAGECTILEALDRDCFMKQTASIAAKRSSNNKNKSLLNVVAMETTGGFGECRFRRTEGAAGGKGMQTASEDQVPREGFCYHLLNVSVCIVLCCVGKTVGVLKDLWSLTRETNHGLVN